MSQGSFQPAPSGRWYPDQMFAGAAQSLEAEVADIANKAQAGAVTETNQDNSQTLIWGITGLVTGALLLLVLALFVAGERDPNHEFTLRSILTLTLIFVGLPVGTYVACSFYFGVIPQKLKQRKETLEKLAAEHQTLQRGYSTRITGQSVGILPWLASEMDLIVECDLYGGYERHFIALLKCTHVVDMTLSNLDAKFGKFASTVMSHVEHEHVHRRCLDAIVFLRPNDALPDIWLAPSKQPLNWYFKKQLGLPVEPAPGKPFWMISSTPRAAEQIIGPEIERLLLSHPDTMIQVLGGYMVVVPQAWNANRPTEMPSDEKTVSENLRLAVQIYEALGRQTAQGVQQRSAVQQAQGAAATPEPASVSRPPATREAAAMPPARAPASVPAAPAKKNWLLRGLAIAFGLGMSGLGTLILLAMFYMSYKASTTAEWPQAPGRIVNSSIQTRGERRPRYAVQVEYEYEVDGATYHSDQLQIGSTEWESDKGIVEEVVARYPQGAAVDVYYDPSRHEEAVLEPGMANQGIQTCINVFAGGMILAGLLLLFLGFRPLRKK